MCHRRRRPCSATLITAPRTTRCWTAATSRRNPLHRSASAISAALPALALLCRRSPAPSLRCAVSAPAYEPGVAGDEEGRERPAGRGRSPCADNPQPASRRVSVRAPVFGLVHVDDRDDRVDRVPKWVEARVIAG